MSFSETVRSLGRRMDHKLPNRRGSSTSPSFVAGPSFVSPRPLDSPPVVSSSSLPRGSITVVGSINMDHIGLVDSHVELNRHIHIRSSKSIKMPGGHGLNQAIACVRLSHRPPPLVKDRETDSPAAIKRKAVAGRPAVLVSHDVDISVKLVGMFGRSDEQCIRDQLHAHGVDTTCLRALDVDTGAAYVSVDPSGTSKVESFANANDRLRPEDIPPLDPPPDLILLQLETPVDTVQRVVNMARDAVPPVPVIFNPAPAGIPIPDDLWRVDHLIMNTGRADETHQALAERRRRSSGGLGKRRPSAATVDTGTGTRTVKEYWDDCEHFHELGARCVIITMGQNGAVASVREGERSNRSRKFYAGALVARSSETAVKDMTGASDAFIGAYAVEILRQKKGGEEEDINRAMEMGIKAGGLTVSAVGSMASIPWREDVLGTDFDGVLEVGD